MNILNIREARKAGPKPVQGNPCWLYYRCFPFDDTSRHKYRFVFVVLIEYQEDRTMFVPTYINGKYPIKTYFEVDFFSLSQKY